MNTVNVQIHFYIDSSESFIKSFQKAVWRERAVFSFRLPAQSWKAFPAVENLEGTLTAMLFNIVVKQSHGQVSECSIFQLNLQNSEPCHWSLIRFWRSPYSMIYFVCFLWSASQRFGRFSTLYINTQDIQTTCEINYWAKKCLTFWIQESTPVSKLYSNNLEEVPRSPESL